MSIHILSAVRTPFGAFGGALRNIPAKELVAAAAAEALRRTDPDLGEKDRFILGQVLRAGTGPCLAHQISSQLGFPHCQTWTLNQGIASGLRAVMSGLQELKSGAHKVLVGGVESMSGAPYLLPSARWGGGTGASTLLDSLLVDGQETTSDLDTKDSAPPSALEAWLRECRQRFRRAQSSGSMNEEVVPLGHTTRILETDEAMSLDLPLFSLGAGGSQTAPAADGAAMLLLSNDRPPDQKPLARLLGHFQTSQGNETPEGAFRRSIRELLNLNRLTWKDLDVLEVGDHCADRTLKLLAAIPEMDAARINPWGGGLALGYPLGAGGARIVVSLVHALKQNRGQFGIAVLSVGKWNTAVLVENCL